VQIDSDKDFYGMATWDSVSCQWDSSSIYIPDAGTSVPNTNTAAYELIGTVSIDQDTNSLNIANANQGNIFFSPAQLAA
jgi:hypothetical protein